MGFISRGGQTGVIRGTGASTVAPFGFSPVIPDPYMSVYDDAGSRIAVNDNWQMDPYTVQLQGTGYGLLELYSVNLN